MRKITPFLWFDGNAEEAMNFYAATFPNTKINGVTRYPEGGPMPGGMVMTASVELEGLSFTFLNGGPMFKFTEAISFVIHCASQEEVDHYWNNLTTDGGAESQCGWLKDKFGLSWQIVPDAMIEMLQDKNAAKSGSVMRAMMTMKKIDIATLKAAYDAA